VSRDGAKAQVALERGGAIFEIKSEAAVGDPVDVLFRAESVPRADR
jgi:hypothetical protein